jgi:chaperone modulatory protein CbpM
MTRIDPSIEGQLLDETTWLALGELCACLQVGREWVAELVEAGVLEPSGESPDSWAFPASVLPRALAATRLVHDLGVNPAGVALVLDLLEERRRLERQLALLERLLES